MVNYLYLFLAFGVGCAIGGILERYKWRNNADRIQGIASNGKIYKVLYQSDKRG